LFVVGQTFSLRGAFSPALGAPISRLAIVGTEGPSEDGPWSFYICSSGGGLNEGWIGDSEAERQEHLRLLGHFLAQQRDEI